MPPDLRKLFIRFAELGALLTPEDDFDPTDARAVAQHKLVLSEMEKVRTAIFDFQWEGAGELRKTLVALEKEFGTGFDSPPPNLKS